jgi:hypothetical protein
MTQSHRIRRSLAGAIFASFVLGFASCDSGGTLNPVHGKVMVGGKPAAGASVVFQVEGSDINDIPATGTCGSDGTFSLVTRDKPGARAGKYIVTVIWPDTAKKPTEQQMMMGLGPDAPDLLGGRYASAKTSPLQAEVKSGENNLEPFDLN